MRTIVRKRYFLRNEEAVSEEFTVLPALSVVMIGIALFILLVAQTYGAYIERIDRLQTYQTVDGLFIKLMNPDCFFIKSPGLINLYLVQNETTLLQKFFGQYIRSGFLFQFQIKWSNQTWFFPKTSNANPLNRIAVSKAIGIYLNEAQTVPGTMTLLLWK
jgi:hypothetical protein